MQQIDYKHETPPIQALEKEECKIYGSNANRIVTLLLTLIDSMIKSGLAWVCSERTMEGPRIGPVQHGYAEGCNEGSC